VTAGAQPHDPDWRNVVLAEYQAHRAEVLAEGQGQQQTLTFGVTAVGILAAGGFNVWDDRLPAVGVFLGAIPFLCILILVQWSGRTAGLMRIGAYLERLEKALRRGYPNAPASVLSWEETLAKLRPKRWWKPHHGWSDFGAFSIFVLLAAGSIALGTYRGYAGNESLVIVLVALEGAVLLAFAGPLAWHLLTVRQRARRDFPNA
jgi:hypothetical protein